MFPDACLNVNDQLHVLYKRITAFTTVLSYTFLECDFGAAHGDRKQSTDKMEMLYFLIVVPPQ